MAKFEEAAIGGVAVDLCHVDEPQHCWGWRLNDGNPGTRRCGGVQHTTAGWLPEQAAVTTKPHGNPRQRARHTLGEPTQQPGPAGIPADRSRSPSAEPAG